MVLLSACSSTASFNEENLNQISIEVEKIDAERSGYQMTLTGFQHPSSPLYRSVLKHLRNARPGDVAQIIEVQSKHQTSNNEHEIDVLITEPVSLNRILWSFGKESYRQHRVEYSKGDTGKEYFIMDRMPELIGGLCSLEIDTPSHPALNDSETEGDVILEFIVNEFGEVEEPIVTKSLNKAADQKALRLIKKATFRPGMYDGVPVRVKMSLPVTFRN